MYIVYVHCTKKTDGPNEFTNKDILRRKYTRRTTHMREEIQHLVSINAEKK